MTGRHKFEPTLHGHGALEDHLSGNEGFTYRRMLNDFHQQAINGRDIPAGVHKKTPEDLSLSERTIAFTLLALHSLAKQSSRKR